MKKIIFLIGLAIVFLILARSGVNGEVLFQDNFDSQANWTVLQPTGSTNFCYPGNCTPGNPPNNWSGYYNGACLCDGISGEPGNNLLYINQYAGYPNETNTCRGGSGKCWTYWQESCVNYFDNSDGMLFKDLGQEYQEVYIRIYMKFKSGWERKVDHSSFKLFHVQHIIPGTNPYIYHDVEGGQNNRPLAAGGIREDAGYMYLYGDGLCYTNISCHGDILWSLGTITAAYQAGGIFDGNWHSIEWRFKSNTVINTANGIVEVWFDGVKLNYFSGYIGNNINFNDAGSSELRGFRYIGLGGNSESQWDTSCSNMADCEQWYAIDDVVISTTYIGSGLPVDNSPQAPRGFSISQN